MAAKVHDSTGEMTWKHGKTWYRVIGDLKSKQTPVVVLHGGPGAPHNYVLPMARLINATGRPVIVYDQIGCGKSSLLKNKPASFWTVELFEEELNLMLKKLKISNKYILAGQSWGGILSFAHAVKKPKGLKGLIIANSLASVPKWLPEIQRLVSELPAIHRKAIATHMKTGKYTHPDFVAANDYFTSQHLVRIPPPQDVVDGFEKLGKDARVYEAMWGPVEFAPIGSLKTWDVEKSLKNIKVPTLLINGKYDEVTPATQKRLVKKIKGAEWVCLPLSSHLAYVEEPAAWLNAVSDFMKRRKI